MNLKDTQQVTVSVALEDAKGNPTTAPLDAPPVFGLDDASFGDVAVAADGMSATLTPNGKLGVCHLQFSASVGGKALVATSEDINVVASDATQVVMTLGTPQDIPAAAPAAPAAPASN